MTPLPPRPSAIVAALLGLVLAGPPAAAQNPTPTATPAPLPESEIYLASIEGAGPGLTITAPANITNHPGYDNQPKFEPDGRSLVFTRGDQGSATDIFRYELAGGKVTPVKETPWGEYSPTPMPDGRGHGVVRVEGDGTQRLWRLVPGPDDELLLPGIKPVGYFAFPNREAVVAFVLGEPPTLQLIDIASGKSRLIASDVGRSIQKIPGKEAVSFLHKVRAEEWWIKEVDASGEVSLLARAPEGREDYAWLNPTTLIISDGSRVLALELGGPAEWREIANLESFGLGDLSRLAVSPDGKRIALVAVPK